MFDMSGKMMMRRLSAAAVGGGVLLALAGCLNEDENQAAIVTPDSVVAVVELTPPAAVNPPTAASTATTLELISFDPNALDAFGRATVRNSSSQWPYWNRWFDGGEWSIGRTLGVEGFLTAEEDPRTPALSFTNADVAFDYLFMFLNNNAFGIGMNWFGEFCCATPGEKYVVGLMRAELTVNGELDATQILQGQAVDQPDALAPLGGSPKGDHTFPAGLFAERPAIADANPFLIGTVQACPAAAPYLPYGADCASQGFPDGELVIDFVFNPLNDVFTSENDPTAEDAPVSPNHATRFTLPSYNYFVIWETDASGAPDFSRPLSRVQLGVDLSPLGGPINNAYAPFPTGALADAELALGTGGVSRPDSVVLELENLEALQQGSTYQVFARLDDGSFQRLSFLLNGQAVSSFNGAPDPVEIQLEFPDNATHIVVTIEQDDDGQPSNRQILWSEGLQTAGVEKSLSLPVQFGAFTEMRTWNPGGTATAGLFGEEFRVVYNQLPRPPVGYKYVGWLVSEDAKVRLPDGSFTSPPREFAVLEAADTNLDISPVVQPATILEAMTRICVGTAEGCFDVTAFDSFVLTLEPRLGISAEPSPTRVFTGLIPTG